MPNPLSHRLAVRITAINKIADMIEQHGYSCSIPRKKRSDGVHILAEGPEPFRDIVRVRIKGLSNPDPIPLNSQPDRLLRYDILVVYRHGPSPRVWSFFPKEIKKLWRATVDVEGNTHLWVQQNDYEEVDFFRGIRLDDYLLLG